jgi:hypothetical protein
MADRTTSFAKSIESLTHPESALDEARRLRDAFTRRAEHQQIERQKERPEDRGSWLIANDAPAPRPAPSGPMRWPADREASATRMSAERNRENRKIAAAELAHAFRQRQPPRGHERDRER